MKDFKEVLLKAVDDAMQQASETIVNFNNVFDTIDFDSYFDIFNQKKDVVLAKGNALLGSFNDFVDTVKNAVNGIYVTLPFNKDAGDNLSVLTKNGVLTVEVTNEDGQNYSKHSSTVSIPDDCDPSGVETFFDKVLKTVTVVVPKKTKSAKKKYVKPETKLTKIKRPRPTDMNYMHQKRDSKGRFIKG